MKYSFPAFENGFIRAAAASPALYLNPLESISQKSKDRTWQPD